MASAHAGPLLQLACLMTQAPLPHTHPTPPPPPLPPVDLLLPLKTGYSGSCCLQIQVIFLAWASSAYSIDCGYAALDKLQSHVADPPKAAHDRICWRPHKLDHGLRPAASKPLFCAGIPRQIDGDTSGPWLLIHAPHNPHVSVHQSAPLKFWYLKEGIPGLGCQRKCSCIQVHLDTLPPGASPTMDEVFGPLSSGLHRLHLDDQLEVTVVTGMCLENRITPCLLRSGNMYKLWC